MANVGAVPVQIDVWSDISCPWCYVGKLRLDQAIKNVENSTGSKVAEAKWHPYIIDVRTNPAGEEYLAYNRRRWGSDGWTSSLRRSGAKDGASFKSWNWWPNSFNGHRLIHLAESYGKAAEAKHGLFLLTYEEGKNISDIDVLCSLGDQLGLPNVREYLGSDRGKQEVLEADQMAKQTMGIEGVPYFVFNRKYAVSGARVRQLGPCYFALTRSVSQDTESLEATIHKLLKA